MTEPHEMLRDASVHDNPQLFVQLANERGFLGLARGYLAARKFPASGHVLTGRTLSNEDTAGVIKQRTGDDQYGGLSHASAPGRSGLTRFPTKPHGNSCISSPIRRGKARCDRSS